eukprot:COSAG05_NODE_1713_length_4230_cov_3.216897_2_plen_254_part_00
MYYKKKRTGWDCFIRPPNGPPILHIMCHGDYAPLLEGAIFRAPLENYCYIVPYALRLDELYIRPARTDSRELRKNPFLGLGALCGQLNERLTESDRATIHTPTTAVPIYIVTATESLNMHTRAVHTRCIDHVTLYYYYIILKPFCQLKTTAHTLSHTGRHRPHQLYDRDGPVFLGEYCSGGGSLPLPPGVGAAVGGGSCCRAIATTAKFQCILKARGKPRAMKGTNATSTAHSMQDLLSQVQAISISKRGKGA